MIPPPLGAVQLTDKVTPVVNQESNGTLRSAASPYVFTRGSADISLLKSLIDRGGEDLWNEAVHEKKNIRITRPSHDNWGVRKAIFIYCDDFLKCVYRFPWLDEWEPAIKPILSVLGIDKEKVVRCLLASMPPGCDIPVHHDSGYWVKHTHRIHVPVVTQPGPVQFQVGPNPDAMQDFEFAEGQILELNNQAKHAVRNNWDFSRIHLILDYVEDYPVQVMQMKVGDRVAQTRRSIDIIGSPDSSLEGPAFIIIGAQKCGTTSLYSYLNQHPLVLKGRRRETHFFDWRWQHQLKTVKKQQEFYRKFFYGDVLQKHRSLITGESTPSYLLHFNIVIPRLKAVCPLSKLIVMLRDPVERAYSHFQMEKQNADDPAKREKFSQVFNYENLSFKSAVDMELEAFNQSGITSDSSWEEFQVKYLDKLPEKLNHGSHSLLARGLYALQLLPWMEAFNEQKLKIILLDDLNLNLTSVMDDVHQFIGLPPNEIIDKGPFNTRDYEPMDEETRTKLYSFYDPFNKKLGELLGRDIPWQFRTGDLL